jgi:DNA-binding IclR family transcriptional regulator
MAGYSDQIVSTGAKTADRVLHLLLAVARSEEPVGVTDLSRITGYDRAAVHRLIVPLVDHQFVARERDSKRYVLGSGLTKLWALSNGKLGLRGHARPVMERIAADTSETVSIHVRDDLHRICIDSVEGTHAVRRVIPIGSRAALHAGPTGKTMLAYLPEPSVQAAIAQGVDAGEPAQRVQEAIAEARAQGYLVRVGDRISGVGGLTVPIFDASGIVAVMTISGPAERFTVEVMQAAAPSILQACDELSAMLGSARGAIA